MGGNGVVVVVRWRRLGGASGGCRRQWRMAVAVPGGGVEAEKYDCIRGGFT